MRARALSCRLAAASALAAAFPGTAEVAPGTTEVAPAQCELPAGAPLANRVELLAQYERLPPSCLRSLFAQCSAAAGQGLLDFDSAATCSFGYEALLKQGFGGNFHALLAWWEGERGPTRRE